MGIYWTLFLFHTLPPILISSVPPGSVKKWFESWTSLVCSLRFRFSVDYCVDSLMTFCLDTICCVVFYLMAMKWLLLSATGIIFCALMVSYCSGYSFFDRRLDFVFSGQLPLLVCVGLSLSLLRSLPNLLLLSLLWLFTLMVIVWTCWLLRQWSSYMLILDLHYQSVLCVQVSYLPLCVHLLCDLCVLSVRERCMCSAWCVHHINRM